MRREYRVEIVYVRDLSRQDAKWAMVWTSMTSYSNKNCLCLEMKVRLMFPRLN